MTERLHFHFTFISLLLFGMHAKALEFSSGSFYFSGAVNSFVPGILPGVIEGNETHGKPIFKSLIPYQAVKFFFQNFGLIDGLTCPIWS